MIKCKLCNNYIDKCKLDLEDTIILNINDEEIYICDDCAYNIALQRISK